MLKRSVFILLLSVLKLSDINAQGTAGKDFWVGFMAHDWDCYYNNTWNTGDTVELFISSQVAATVNIEAPGQGYTNSITLAPNVTSMVRLPREVVCRYSDTVTTNGVHVFSNQTINVYAVNRFWYSKGAAVVIPTESIVQSPEYFVTTNEEKFSWGWSCNGKTFNSAEFVIVGIADSSVIEIVPTGASTRFTNKNTPFQIRLKKGQTFQYMTTDNDLSGSIIRSKYSKSKYAVFAGNRMTYTGDWTVGSCNSSWDHIYEQMLPTVTWGQNYTSLPYKNNPGGYYMKVMAAENRTTVSLNGVYYATLNQGQFFEYDVLSDTPVSITANKRISVAQFTKGYACSGHPKNWPRGNNALGDPAMMMLFPNEQFGQNATVNTVSQNNWWWWSGWWSNNEHYVSIMTRTADTASFAIDNAKVKGSEWKTSSNIGNYSYTAVKIDSGSHYLSSNKGFLGYVYGYGYVEGYAFAAAANFKPIQNNFLIENAQCKRDTVKFSAIDNDSFGSYSWRFGDNSPIAYGKTSYHKYKDTGWYSVTMFCKHVITGHLDSVSKDLYISDTKIRSLLYSDTAFCGPIDMFVMTKGFNLDNEYQWDNGHKVYYRLIKKPGIYWAEVTERNGCVFRDTLIVSTSGIPKANFTVSDTMFCLSRNKNVSFKNLSTSIDSLKEFSWDFGHRSFKTFDKDSIVHNRFPRANTYPVILRAITKYGCYHDTVKYVDVLNSPKADFTFTKKDTCFNTNGIELKNNTVISPANHKRYKWYFSEGYVQSNSNPGPRSYTATGNYKVMLIYENNNGCIDTMMRTVEVVPNPKAAFVYANSAFCSLDSIPFKSTSVSAYRPLAYTWQWGDSTISGSDSMPFKIYKKAGTYKIKLMVTSPKGCRDSATNSILVNSTPEIDFAINKDTQCFSGHNFTYINRTKFLNGSLNYNWDLGDGISKTDSNILSKSYQRDSVYNVRLSTTSQLGCFASITKKVYIGSYPVAKLQVTPLIECFRDNRYDFTDLSTIKKGSIVSKVWYLGNGDSSSLPKISGHHYSKEDTFRLRLIVKSNLGCKDTAEQQVVVYPQPKATFAVNNSTQCMKQQDFRFRNQTTLRYGKLTYQWNFGDGKTSADTNYNKKYSKDTSYNVRLVAVSDKGCRDTVNKTVTLNVSPDALFSMDKDKQCFKGNIFNFTNQSKVSKGVITGYAWNMGNAGSLTTRDVSSYTYNSEDTFKVRMVVYTDKLCTDTLLRPAIVFAQPKVDIRVPNDSQCWHRNSFVLVNKTKLKYGKLNNSWSFGDNTSSTDYQPVSKVYPNTSATYTIAYVAVSDHGCRDSGRHKVALLERPVSEFSINDSIQCFNGHSFSFVNKTTFSAMNTMQYWWDYANGDTSMGILPKQMVYAQPGLYKMRLISYSTLTNCYDTLYKTLVSAPHPVMGFSINNDLQCLRFNQFVFNNGTRIGFGKMSYQWSFGDGTFDTAANPVKSYLSEGAYIVRLVANSDYDCKDSLEKPVGFYPSPKALFSINDTAQCLNKHSFDFTNASTLRAGNMSYQWLFSDHTSGNFTDIGNKRFVTAGTHTARLSVLTDKGCTDTLSRTVYLENNKNSTINFTENDSQCLRGNMFNFKSLNNNSLVSFASSKWVFGNGQESLLPVPPSQSFGKDGSFKVMLLTLSQNGCDDTTYADVVIHPHPVSKFSVDTVCFPEAVEFTNLSTISSGQITGSEWLFGDGKRGTSSNASHVYASASEYDVELISVSSFGCRDSVKVVKAVKVQDKPKADFDFEQLSTLTLDETRYQFRNRSSANAVKYLWDFGNQTNSQDTNPIGIFTDTGNYRPTLIVFTSEGCSDTLSKPTGVVIPDFFYFLPNAFSPNGDAHNNVYKGAGSVFVYRFNMQIYNRWGEKMFETDDITKGWDGYYNGELCMEGAYLCKVQLVPMKGTFKAYQQMFHLLR
jgi:gliding motility-associated-like protein